MFKSNLIIINLNTYNMNKICYTGLGSNKKKYHSKKKFIKIMNKNFKNDCKEYHESLTCNSCKKKSIIFKKLMKTKKKSKKSSQKFNKYAKQCVKCKKNRRKNCDFNEYIIFSGAQIGKC